LNQQLTYSYGGLPEAALSAVAALFPKVARLLDDVPADGFTGFQLAAWRGPRNFPIANAVSFMAYWLDRITACR
jgi:hypothetical protein